MEHRSLRLRSFLPAVARALALAALLASCSSPPALNTPFPREATPTLSEAKGSGVGKGDGGLSPSPTPSPVSLLRFALIGSPRQLNAWALFDGTGAAYADRAVHSGEYPALYRLSIPGREFEPYIAAGLPSAISQDGELYTATAKLQTGLRWSDGSPLTARDVAFAANIALAFDLGQDWSAAYDPAVLARAEAVDEWTVRFFFKRPPNVGDWQYGLLQGPILSESFWSPKLSDAAALLPPADVLDSLEKARAEAADLQKRIAADQAQLLTTPPGSPDSIELSARIKRSQDDLNAANTRISRLGDERDAALAAARAVLFGLPGAGEPTFGPFLRAVKSGALYTRDADASYPFAKPDYGRLSYTVFSTPQAAAAALAKGDVDFILAPDGIPSGPLSAALKSQPSLKLVRSPSASARFLVFNPTNRLLAKTALRQALSCAIDRAALASALSAQPLDGFVLPGSGSWRNPDTGPQCSYQTGNAAAVALLKEAGYRWAKEPAGGQSGEGFLLPDGSPFPALTLLSPGQDSDPQRLEAARLVALYAGALGIPLSVQYASPEDVRYAVYSSGRYDMALLGWRLGEYPAYLCEWFQPPGAFAYDEDGLRSACGRLNLTADLGTARGLLYDIQSILMRDLPFLPLYQGVELELSRNASWPWDQTLGGLSPLFGAPESAFPTP